MAGCPDAAAVRALFGRLVEEGFKELCTGLGIFLKRSVGPWLASSEGAGAGGEDKSRPGFVRECLLEAEKTLLTKSLALEG